MSTLTMTTSSRQPFASLNGARLRNLTNTKNTQNALPSVIASPLKRRAPEDFDNHNTENIDPVTFSSPSKKHKTFDFDLSKSVKPSHFTLASAKPAQYVETVRLAGQNRRADKLSTPHINVSSRPSRITPSSAPAPAGRSPTKSKRTGILSRRRMTASPFTRINPPTFAIGEGNSALPFSIDAALAGTVPALKSKKPSPCKTWHFDIHEDSPDDEMANLMEHSTCTLDISDDEGRANPKGDKDNKENIPPVDDTAIPFTTSQMSATRRDMMTDEARNPLGDLDATDFYAEGYDSSSFILVPAECSDLKPTAATNVEEPFSPSHSRFHAITDSREDWKNILADLATKSDSKPAKLDVILDQCDSTAEPTEIQIWESESAKAENDAETQDLATDILTSVPAPA